MWRTNCFCGIPNRNASPKSSIKDISDKPKPRDVWQHSLSSSKVSTYWKGKTEEPVRIEGNQKDRTLCATYDCQQDPFATKYIIWTKHKWGSMASMVDFPILLSDGGDMSAFSNYRLKYLEVMTHLANLLSNGKTKSSLFFCSFSLSSRLFQSKQKINEKSN